MRDMQIRSQSLGCIAVLSAFAALGGCASGSGREAAPSMTAPAAPSSYAGLAADLPAAAPSWVTAMSVQGLDTLVVEAWRANPDLAETASRVEQSEALARQANAARRFQLDAGASASRSDTGIQTPAGNDRVGTTRLGADLSASWEVDLWGRLSDRSRAAELDLVAARADFEDARIALAGRVATSLVDLIEASTALKLAQTETDTRRRVLALTERRFAAGLVRTIDVRTARSALASSEASLADAERVEGLTRRGLEVLLGRYPATSISTADPLPELNALTQPGSPQDLLQNRPDLRAAEARLRSAGLDVDAARKAMRPSLRLSASLSQDAEDLSDLFDVELLAARIAANLAAPLIDGGARRAEVERTEAARRGAAAAYVRATLVAWREVEDALAADTSLARREDAVKRAAVESRAAETLAIRQYGEGLSSIFEVLDAVNRRLDADRLEIAIRAQRLNNRINYHVALGAEPLSERAPTGEPTP
jgi:outer membrane protein, multidrug efflux system